MQYEAILVVSFGGPEGPDDVIPFLENVLRGKDVPRDRMLAVARHYDYFGGVSPLNAQNRVLVAALQRELDSHGPQLPVFWGNRNFHPLLPATLEQMANAGVHRPGPVHVGLQLLLVVPSVSRRHPAGAGNRGVQGAANR